MFVNMKAASVIFSFIRCFSDAKLTGAKSYFMPRSQEDKLHFQLKAFRFYQDDRNSVSTSPERCARIYTVYTTPDY